MTVIPTSTPLLAPSETAWWRSPRTRLWLALGVLYLIWGSTYLVMRFAIEGLPPFIMSGLRFTIAGAIMLTFARTRGAPWPSARQWRNAAIVGTLFFLCGNGFVAIAERDIDSGLAAVVCATMPLWLAVYSALSNSAKRPGRREWLGLVLGFAGVALLASGSNFGATPGAAVAIMFAPITWALASFLAQRLELPSGMASPAAQMLCGGTVLLAAGALRGEVVHTPTPESIGALVYLIVLGSLVGFTAFTWLLRNARPAVASSYAYVNPPIAVLLGVMLGAETLPPSMLVALPLIVASVMLVVMKGKTSR